MGVAVAAAGGGGDLREDWGLVGCDATAEVCCCITVATINHSELSTVGLGLCTDHFSAYL